MLTQLDKRINEYFGIPLSYLMIIYYISENFNVYFRYFRYFIGCIKI